MISLFKFILFARFDCVRSDSSSGTRNDHPDHSSQCTPEVSTGLASASRNTKNLWNEEVEALHKLNPSDVSEITRCISLLERLAGVFLECLEGSGDVSLGCRRGSEIFRRFIR